MAGVYSGSSRRSQSSILPAASFTPREASFECGFVFPRSKSVDLDHAGRFGRQFLLHLGHSKGHLIAERIATVANRTTTATAEMVKTRL